MEVIEIEVRYYFPQAVAWKIPSSLWTLGQDASLAEIELNIIRFESVV